LVIPKQASAAERARVQAEARLAAARQTGVDVGTKYGEVIAEAKNATEVFQRYNSWKKGNPLEEAWRRTFAADFARNMSGLPQLSDFSTAAENDAALEGFVKGVEAGASAKSREIFAANLGFDLVIAAIAGSAGGLGGGAGSALRTVTVYRVEGSVGARILIGEGGRVTIVTGERMLFLNFGERARAEEFFAKRVKQGVPGATLKSFEVPKEALEATQAEAVPERLASQFPGRPLVVDTTKAINQFGLRMRQMEALQKLIVQGSGKVEK